MTNGSGVGYFTYILIGNAPKCVIKTAGAWVNRLVEIHTLIEQSRGRPPSKAILQEVNNGDSAG